MLQLIQKILKILPFHWVQKKKKKKKKKVKVWLYLYKTTCTIYTQKL